MTFGDVGLTKEHEYGEYHSDAVSVGEFDQTVLLERQAPVETLVWTTSSTPSDTPLYQVDLNKYLANYTRNSGLLSQFTFMRADIEVTMRLNTNQFYFGALMATMYPTDSTGLLLEQRAVLDPMIISASSAESIIKTWKYSWPQGWMRVSDVQAGKYPVYFNIDVLNQLSIANATMPDSVDVFVWARYTNIRLAYPSDTSGLMPLAQSGTGFSKPLSNMSKAVVPVVKKGIEKKTQHPSDDKGNTVDQVVDAVKRVQLGDLYNVFSSLAGFLFDKPDMYEKLQRMVIDNNVDMYITDVPDVNTYIGMKSDHYLDPSNSRMPLSRNYSVSDYARIPGLRLTNYPFSTLGTSYTFSMVSTASSLLTGEHLIPLDYACQCAVQWRGSVKLCLQFFTSAFFSGRFVLQYFNSLIGGVSTDYSNGISRVINVKGDTVDCITLPFLSFRRWYQATDAPTVTLKLISTIASTDTAEDPTIYVSAWISGGDDIQFAYPSTPYDWGVGGAVEPLAQTSIGSIFKESFPTINPGAFAEIDEGFCTNETLESITAICKRYSPMNFSLVYQDQFDEQILDTIYSSSFTNPQLDLFRAFNATFFGTWRSCFLFRSGGFRLRSLTPDIVQGTSSYTLWQAAINGNGAITYRAPFDDLFRMTVPQVDRYPFRILNPLSTAVPYDFQYFVVKPLGTGGPYTSATNPHMIAARDDLQFGFPILPARIPAAPTFEISGHQPQKMRETMSEKTLSPDAREETSVKSFKFKGEHPPLNTNAVWSRKRV